MTATVPPGHSQLRSRAQLILLAVLFFAPFVSAYIAVFVFDWRPGGERTNYGQLVTPARPTPVIALRDAAGQPLASDPLREKWSLVQLLRGPCDEACHRELVLSRQTRLALGRQRERVQRVLIADDPARLAELRERLGAEQPGLLWLLDAETGPKAFEQFADLPANALLVLDPHGNWLMWYPPVGEGEAAVQQDFKGLQKDINKLLKLSHIG
ncbi:hypothetical protein ED208_05365 [Stagnimonas aquatica]|uniref:Cytochrome C oxidase subunit I n=1 Tax=Stagnimonas aquatica TaxID=2689987 RepID=A0A3N0VGM6_9GAMM|nr:hypothetical protein [Stagnimonas aquatica]ROH91810.1 hypothetical protein ED208_05365 [Stagnimonas aquatica]